MNRIRLCACLFGTWVLVAFSMELFAQFPPGSVLKGQVLNEAGQPLEGITINEKGIDNVTNTAVDGGFSLTLKGSSKTLVFTAIGYEPKIVSVHHDDFLSIVLEGLSTSLDEVVIVGYAQTKKENLTGAVASISSKALQNRPVTNIGQALQGQVANLSVNMNNQGGAPDARQNLNIRGYTGFGVSTGPLIVIDGVPGGDLNSLNPADIATLTVLKDAAAAAIYGSSAPYGVLLVTTKQGQKNGKPAITYNNNFSFNKAINLPKMVNSLDFAQTFNEAFTNAGRAPWYDSETLQRISDYQAGILQDETIKDPNYDDWYGSGIGYFTGSGPNKGNGNNDWFDIFFRPAFSHQHNLGVSGGGNSSTYYVGAGYLSRDGIYNFMRDKFQRYNLRANLSTEIAKWMTVNFRSTLSREQNNTPATYSAATGGNYMHQIARKLPTTPFRNPDGHYSDYSNIALFTEGGRNTYTDNRSMLTGEVVLRPLVGWQITGNFTYDGRFYNEENFNKTVYSTLPSGNRVVQFQTNPVNSLTKISSTTDHYIINLFSSYEKQLSQHYFQVLGGYIRDYTHLKSINAGNSLLYSNDIPSLNLTYNPNATIGDSDIRLAIEGIFGRFNYNYDGKYLLEFNGRYDASSRFTEGSRWNLYTSVSAGYLMSKEAFWEPIKPYVNMFKLRGSYGSLGDQWGDNPNRNNYYPFYPSLGTRAPNNTNWIFNDGRQAYITPPGLVNNALTWATITSLNLAFDAELLKSRLAVSLDWYRRDAVDFVGPAQALPAVLGTAVPFANIASMKTTGFELTVGWNDQIGNVNYFARGVLSDYTATVLDYPNPSGLLSDWYQGMRMGEIWGFETMGLFQSTEEISEAPSQHRIFGGNWAPGDVRYRDRNGDNEITIGTNTLSDPGDRKVIGNSTPRYAYGMTLGGQWKGFDASVFLQGVAKRDAWIGSNMYWGIVGGEWQSTYLVENQDRWTPESPDGFFPKYYMSNEMNKNMQQQTRYLQNAAYMRLKNVQIGYNFPPLLINRIQLQNLRIYISGDNLATFTKMQKSVDPELAIDAGKIYPLQRFFSFGLNLTL